MKCYGRPVPQLQDVTVKAGIHFSHVLAPEAKYIPESMSGGVLLLDYDRDGWLDIYFTNAPTIAMALNGANVRGALYHNNHDGTFTDVTDKAGIATPCFAMGGAVGDYNNDGWPDIYATCLHGNVLYRNNGDGTFSDVTAKAGVADGRWSTGAAFADYDGDGFLDLFVANYTEFDIHHPPVFGSSKNCKYMGVDVQCGPRGLKGAGDALFHNNGDGTFTDVSKRPGVDDPRGTMAWVSYGQTSITPDVLTFTLPTTPLLITSIAMRETENLQKSEWILAPLSVKMARSRPRWALRSATIFILDGLLFSSQISHSIIRPSIGMTANGIFRMSPTPPVSGCHQSFG